MSAAGVAGNPISALQAMVWPSMEEKYSMTFQAQAGCVETVGMAQQLQKMWDCFSFEAPVGSGITMKSSVMSLMPLALDRPPNSMAAWLVANALVTPPNSLVWATDMQAPSSIS